MDTWTDLIVGKISLESVDFGVFLTRYLDFDDCLVKMRMITRDSVDMACNMLGSGRVPVDTKLCFCYKH